MYSFILIIYLCFYLFLFLLIAFFFVQLFILYVYANNLIVLMIKPISVRIV